MKANSKTSLKRKKYSYGNEDRIGRQPSQRHHRWQHRDRWPPKVRRLLHMLLKLLPKTEQEKSKKALTNETQNPDPSVAPPPHAPMCEVSECGQPAVIAFLLNVGANFERYIVLPSCSIHVGHPALLAQESNQTLVCVRGATLMLRK